MQNKELIEKLQKFDDDLPVEVMINCVNEKCGAVFSTDTEAVFKSERLDSNVPEPELEDCLVITGFDFQLPKSTLNETGAIALLCIREYMNEYYRALDQRQNGNVAAGRLIEKLEGLLDMSWHQGITEEKDANS